MDDLSTEQLQSLQAQTADTLTSLVDSLNERPDMQEAIRRLMAPDDMLERFSELAVHDPDLMRLTLQACVAAMVNLQSSAAVKAELARRAVGN